MRFYLATPCRFIDRADTPWDLDFELVRNLPYATWHIWAGDAYGSWPVANVSIDVDSGYDDHFDDLLPTIELETGLAWKLNELSPGVAPLVFEIEELRNV
jgi:hypothetical protein